MQGAEIVNKKLAGYGMDECNAKREVAKAKLPILFIHGSKDTFVPARMCKEIYDCCASPKKMLIVEGAAHGESYFKSMEAYEKALDDFIDACEGKRGKRMNVLSSTIREILIKSEAAYVPSMLSGTR